MKFPFVFLILFHSTEFFNVCLLLDTPSYLISFFLSFLFMQI
nr:MAG TPA: hypothetical protein [Caudoviricetes sp.]